MPSVKSAIEPPSQKAGGNSNDETGLAGLLSLAECLLFQLGSIVAGALFETSGSPPVFNCHYRRFGP